MGAARDIIIAGLLLGGIYALIAAGLSLQYGVARVLNVSHGEFIMIGAFITWWMFTNLALDPLISIVITGPLMFVLGILLYRFIYRKIMVDSESIDAFEGSSMLAAFGFLYVVQNVARWIWGSNTYAYTYMATSVTSARIPLNRLVALAVVAVVAIIFYVFLSHTRMGKAIRASAQDPTTAGLVGVNVYRVLGLCFGLGLAMAGIAGSLLSILYSVNTSMGLGYTVIALIVVVLGGLGSVQGAFIGGILLGLMSSLVSYYQPSMTMVAYYVVFILLLLIRPKGIMGK
ncbi:MAG: branched-chain amino acid ABC transporter permease [Actinobacteria bacterium]|jgi:branched-chain amino acid transport system permease protein|nr:branched-chain amino acid ABC transporter permease [Actinomycetota bacterium]